MTKGNDCNPITCPHHNSLPSRRVAHCGLENGVRGDENASDLLRNALSLTVTGMNSLPIHEKTRPFCLMSCIQPHAPRLNSTSKFSAVPLKVE